MTAPPAATTTEDYRTYEYPPTGEDLWSYSTIASGTNAKPWIPRWYASSTATLCVTRIGELARIKRLEGRDAAIKWSKGEAERERKIKADAGTYVHAVMEALILWAAGRGGQYIALPELPDHLEGALYKVGPEEYEPLEEVVDNMITGFLNFNREMNPEYRAAEMTVFHQPLGAAGTLDIIARLHGYGISVGTGLNGEDEAIARPGATLDLCIDGKTGKEPEGTWKEQLAFYRRCPECMLKLGEILPMLKTDAGAVLHLRPEYPDGYLLILVSAAEDEAAWERFQAAAMIYNGRAKVRDKPGSVIRPLRPDGTMVSKRLCDLAAEGYSYALAPLRKAFGGAAELTDLAMFTADELLSPTAGGHGIKGIGKKTIDTTRRMLADHGLHLAGETPQTPGTETPIAKAA